MPPTTEGVPDAVSGAGYDDRSTRTNDVKPVSDVAPFGHVSDQVSG